MWCGGFGRHIYRYQIKDVKELHQRVKEKWNSLDQRVIDSAVREWHKRL